MDHWEIEGEAEAILRSVGMDPREDVRTTRLARALGLSLARAGPLLVPGDAVLVRVGEDWRICLRGRLSPIRARFAVAHEIAEWWLRRNGYTGEDAEQVADRLGAALVAPRQRVVWLVRRVPSIKELAAAFEATESLTALRIGEATGEPIALVAPTRVRVRGEPWDWPSEAKLRQVARGPAPRGLVKVELEGPRRVVLRTAG